MGYYKDLLIKQQEAKLSSLYEDYHVEQIIVQAEKQNTIERQMHEELLLGEQLKLDKEENQ
jgi:hypothetical protein